MDNIIPFGEGTMEIIVEVQNPICGIRSKSMGVSSSMMSLLLQKEWLHYILGSELDIERF